MRILEVVDVRWWNACAYYGVELARALAAAGEEVVVAGSPGAPPVEHARALGLEVWTEVRFADPNPFHTAADLRALARGIRRFDVIDTHRSEGHLLGALASAMAGGPPVIRTRGDIRPPRRHPFNRWLYRRLTRAVVVPSELMRKHLVGEFGLPAHQVQVIPAGIDLDHYRNGRSMSDRQSSELRQRFDIRPEESVLGMVARLSPVKGHRDAIRALALLKDRGLRPHLLIAGQEEEVRASELAALARAAGIGEQVHLLGRVEDVRPVLGALDVLIVASLGSEAISRTLLEGMAMARPAVATRVGVVPELVIDGETGMIVPPGDPASMAEALAALISDRERARAMGERARALADREYGLGRWVARTCDLYRRVVDDADRPPPRVERAGSGR